MKKLIYIFVIVVSYFVGCSGVSFAQIPTSPVQLTTNTPYLEPSTGLHWYYNGMTYLWYKSLGVKDSTYYITPYYFNHNTGTSTQSQISLRELLSNKATTFGTLNNTLYPTTQAVANYVSSNVLVTSVFGRTGAVTAQTGDYSSFYPLKNGTGATGTWGIGISGNSATATALQTGRTINGVLFDGTSNISITTTSAYPLTLGNGILGTSYDGTAPITASLDTSIAVTKTYSARYPLKSITVAGFSLRGNITLASLTPNYGLVGSAYNGATAQGWHIDTATIQTIGNFRPLGSQYWAAKISGTGYAKYAGTSVSFVTAIPNTDLSHSSTTINGTTISLGSSGTITATVPNSILFNSSGSGDASGTTFDGSIGHVISYNTIGAAAASSVPALPINITISAGTAIPYNYVYSAYKEPTLVYAIPGTTSTELTTNGCSGMIAKFNYSSSGLTTLVSIDIYGNDDGTGHFNENTYVKVSP